MNIVTVDINKLEAASYNPRIELKAGMPEYEKIKKSIETFGYVDPIIYNKRNNVVIGGHQRLAVLKDLGYTSIDVVEVDLDDSSEKALNIALNKISGDWDADKLEDLLRELNVVDDLDISLTGFDEEELETLFNGSVDDIDLPDNVDEYFRELTDAENEKKDKLYVHVGKDIKFEITQEEYDNIRKNYKNIGIDMFKSYMTGGDRP